jgi:glucose/arabinose dehydrogenase
MKTPTRSLVFLIALCLTPFASAQTLPPNFQETLVFPNLNVPTVVEFAPDGRVFIAEKRGVIKVYPNEATPTFQVFLDIRTQVHNYWDRGLLGFVLHPNFMSSPETSYFYVLYTLDREPGGTTIPRWGVPNADTDSCPTPPGGNTDGCAVTARLSRFSVSAAGVAGSEEVLIDDWCSQFPSHTIGDLLFGEDGALYATGGDGASFGVLDYGQLGGTLDPLITPRNVCGDPPAGVGGLMSPPTAEGGTLRSQSRRRASGGPIVLDGTIVRLDPATGLAHPSNPAIGSSDPNLQRIVADGLRNPYRAAWRPGTNELWVGDVGWNKWEEINRLPNPSGEVLNFGWPCYEGSAAVAGSVAAQLNICIGLYASSGAVTPPVFTYAHSGFVIDGDGCGGGGGNGLSSAITGMAFHPVDGPYPAAYRGALFFTDYGRRCIWAMGTDASGIPNPGMLQLFESGLVSSAIDLSIGPGGQLYYLTVTGGRLVRIDYVGNSGTAPTASFTATPESGPSPLNVLLDASASSDPEGDSLSYAWDLDNDGSYDNAVGVAISHTFTDPGNFTVGLLVTDSTGLSGSASAQISVDNTPPTATILSPDPTVTMWRVGDAIGFSGSATDPEQGALPASALSWTLILQHCPSDCHPHVIQDFVGVDSGTFFAPDHDHPSHLELRLVATDAAGSTHTQSVILQSKTVDLTFDSSPPGLNLGLNDEQLPTPFTRTFIVGGMNSISAPSPQSLSASTYVFSSWSDGGAQSHTITAPDSAQSYSASYTALTTPQVRISDISKLEGHTGTTPFNFPLVLSSPSSKTVTVPWYTLTSGTARSGIDYLAASGTVTFPPFSTSGTITIDVIGDTLKEGKETFWVRLRTPTNATLANDKGKGIILNDD